MGNDDDLGLARQILGRGLEQESEDTFKFRAVAEILKKQSFPRNLPTGRVLYRVT